MEISVGELARRVGGTVHGDEGVLIEFAQSIAKAGPRDITFGIDEQNLRLLKTARPGAILIASKRLAQAQELYPNRTWIVVEDPMGAFIQILQLFRPVRPRRRRKPWSRSRLKLDLIRIFIPARSLARTP